MSTRRRREKGSKRKCPETCLYAACNINHRARRCARRTRDRAYHGNVSTRIRTLLKPIVMPIVSATVFPGFFFSQIFNKRFHSFKDTRVVSGIILSLARYTCRRCSFAGIDERIKDTIKDINVKNTPDVKSEARPDTAFLSKYRKLPTLSSSPRPLCTRVYARKVFFSPLSPGGRWNGDRTLLR